KVTVRLRIEEKNLQAFKDLAKELLSTTKEKDHYIQQYEWYFNKNQTEYVVLESYPNSDALVNHLEQMPDLFGRLLSLLEFQADLFGQPSDKLLKMIEGLDVNYYTFHQSLIPTNTTV